MKDALYRRSLEKCKLRQQGGTTTHLLEKPKFHTLAMSTTGEDVEQEKLSLTAGGPILYHWDTWEAPLAAEGDIK